MCRLVIIALGIAFVGLSFAAEPSKLDKLLRDAKTKAEVQNLLKDFYRIDKQTQGKWLIYSLDEYRQRPDAIVEFKENKKTRTTYLGGAEAVSTNRETIDFVETLYRLLEILQQKGDNTASLALTSFKIRNDVERKIIELRFKDRIISFDIWRDPGDYGSVGIDAIRPEESFFH